jgi:uncharacterized protein
MRKKVLQKLNLSKYIIYCYLALYGLFAFDEFSLNAQIKTAKKIQIGGELEQRILRYFEWAENSLPLKDLVQPTSQDLWQTDTPARALLELVYESQIRDNQPKQLKPVWWAFDNNCNALGYMGDILPDSLVNEQQLQNNGLMFNALCEYYRLTKDSVALKRVNAIIDNLVMPTSFLLKRYPDESVIKSKIVEINDSSKIFSLNGWQLSAKFGGRFEYLKGLALSLEFTHRKELEPIINELLNQYWKTDFKNKRTEYYLKGMQSALILAKIRKDKTLLDSVQNRFRQYQQIYTTPNFESYEVCGANGKTSPTSTSLACSIALNLWQETGKTEYLEYSQKIYYNAIGFQQHSDGALYEQTTTGSVPFFITPAPLDEKKKAINYQYCGEAFRDLVENSLTELSTHLVLTSYQEGEYEVEQGKQRLAFSVQSRYPFVNQIDINIDAAPVKPVALQFPDFKWMRIKSVELNGKNVEIQKINHFLNYTGRLKKGDKLTLKYELNLMSDSIAATNSVKGFMLLNGPLILATGTTSELILPSTAILKPTDDGLFKLNNSNITLHPVYHLLDPSVTNGYILQLIFKTTFKTVK